MYQIKNLSKKPLEIKEIANQIKQTIKKSKKFVFVGETKSRFFVFQQSGIDEDITHYTHQGRNKIKEKGFILTKELEHFLYHYVKNSNKHQLGIYESESKK